ncbi:DUF1822 family protein, partial [Chamaesiphon sp. VAR_48_metabat_403]|uniref:DUF1822 family protein n=1 Tax=Chamaesiphon sp. VAR_48_metabat_403 TaxID=2964700 RepID=UPI00286D9500
TANPTLQTPSTNSVIVGVDVSESRLAICKKILHKYHLQSTPTLAEQPSKKVRIRVYCSDGTTFDQLQDDDNNLPTLVFDSQTATLAQIYPEHVWIDITDLEISLTKAELNCYWIDKVSKYLTNLGLVVKSSFPFEDLYKSLISEAIDGFALAIAGVKVVFIPSHDLDLAGFEVQQEWVDLSNWAADYYVPIQIDREHHYLHLWGFISHRSIQKTATLDRTLRSYEIAGSDLIEDLQILWMSCELASERSLASERGEISALAPVSTAVIQSAIEQLRAHSSLFSPRPILPFEQWGAIMNEPEYLKLYLNPVPAITKIANWFRDRISTSDAILDRGWLTIEQIIDRPQLLPGYYQSLSHPDNLEISPNRSHLERDFYRVVNNFYANQTSNPKVEIPPEIESPSLLLIYLIKHTTDETLRWQAAEYLWSITPDNNQNWHRRIKDLGLVMKGHKLGLMVAAIPLLDGTYAILNRIYPIGTEACLPPNVRLNLLSESGDRLYRVESRATVMDSYIQLYFTASIGDLFNVCVAMNDASITESFVI